MFNFAFLPHEFILNMASSGKLAPKDMVRLMRTSRLFNGLIRDNSLWRPYLPKNLRYYPNLFLQYSAFMQSDKVTPLIKFLIHRKGLPYDQALCVRIRDERVIQKVIREEITLDEARQMMTLSVNYRQRVLENNLTLHAALQLNKPSEERFYCESSFIGMADSNSMLGYLLGSPIGLQILWEGLVDPNVYDTFSDSQVDEERLLLSDQHGPHVLTALREGLVTDTQILQMRASSLIRFVFTEEGLQAMRMGYITAEDAVMCHDKYKLDRLKCRIKTVAANYFDQAGSALIKWLKEYPDFTLHAITLFNHVNGWSLYSQGMLVLADLQRMPSIEFLKALLENDVVIRALLAKKISLGQILILKTVQHLQALSSIGLDENTYWLDKLIDGTINATMFASLNGYEINNLRWTILWRIEHSGKAISDLLRDANCELEHLLTLDDDKIKEEMQLVVPENDQQQLREQERIRQEGQDKPSYELALLLYDYFVQAIRNLTWDVKMRHPMM